MSKIEDLMSKKMTRKQFLTTIGVAVVGIFGLSSIMGILSQKGPDSGHNLVGYGMRDYGP